MRVRVVGGSAPDPVELLCHLIRFASVTGADHPSQGEEPAARWIAARLADAGWQPRLLHRPDAPERANVVIRVPGRDGTLPGVLVHAHLDVVPADAAEGWSVPPFAGVVDDGYVWGRGAQDMLGGVAAALHTLLVWGRDGVRPRRDVVVAFVADEEHGGHFGAQWLVDAHRDLFDGLGVAIGEEGGVGRSVTDVRGSQRHLYTITAAERGLMQMCLRAQGVAGHGSRPHGQEATTRLVRALGRLADHRWPLHLTASVRAQYEQLAAHLGWAPGGQALDVTDESALLAFVDWLGPQTAGPMRWTIRPSVTPTMLQAGTAANVIPGDASAVLDVRCPPGTMDAVERQIRRLAGDDAEIEVLFRGEAVESPIEGPWWDAMCATLRSVDPHAVVVPGCAGGGSDAKAFTRLGLATYGFLPAPADPDGRTASGYHGVDERIPVSQVRGGADMLRHFLETA